MSTMLFIDDTLSLPSPLTSRQAELVGSLLYSPQERAEWHTQAQRILYLDGLISHAPQAHRDMASFCHSVFMGQAWIPAKWKKAGPALNKAVSEEEERDAELFRIHDEQIVYELKLDIVDEFGMTPREINAILAAADKTLEDLQEFVPVSIPPLELSEILSDFTVDNWNNAEAGMTSDTAVAMLKANGLEGLMPKDPGPWADYKYPDLVIDPPPKIEGMAMPYPATDYIWPSAAVHPLSPLPLLTFDPLPKPVVYESPMETFVRTLPASSTFDWAGMPRPVWAEQPSCCPTDVWRSDWSADSIQQDAGVQPEADQGMADGVEPGVIADEEHNDGEYVASDNDDSPEQPQRKVSTSKKVTVQGPKKTVTPMANRGMRFKCDDCKYTADYPSDLKRPKSTHTGERPYKCPHQGCDYAATKSSHLKTHMATHTGERPYKCPHQGCDYAAATSSYLKTHMATHTGERPYKCPHQGCDYAATKSSHLKTHMATHTGERPYKCPHQGCDYAAATSSYLKTHMATHTGERPYKCPHQGCDYAATRSSHLKTHMRCRH